VRGATILDTPDIAASELAALEKVGVDLSAVTEQLQKEGVESFAKSFDDLMAALEKKRTTLAASKSSAGERK
jgi:transaldolase